jgi:UDP-2-acetamido-3-amino-2,3-dideoxy-glucuronate N-acetyltransferase
MAVRSEKLPVSVAVVGMGHWGKNLVRNFYELKALAGLYDSNNQVKESYRLDYPGVKLYHDFGEVLSDPSLAAVALATPAVTHYELAKAALTAGKDVFVEKPLAIELMQGEELVKLATNKNRILMVGHILRYHPAILKLRQLIQNGDLGKINYLYSNRLNIGKIRTEENILWSFAPHDISVMLALLEEMPSDVSCHGGSYLNHGIPDVTLSNFEFPSGVRAHIFVSWLHPIKEQKLIVVGSEKMAVFDDAADNKLVLYPHKVEWKNRIPTAVKAEGEIINLEVVEPLRAECQHFLKCSEFGTPPLTDGFEGLRVLQILDACQRALQNAGNKIDLVSPVGRDLEFSHFVHESAYVDEGATIGKGTKVWHFSHIMKGAKVGERCTIGQNVNIDGGTVIGNNVKIQNNVSVYTGVEIEDDVFLGPSCVLTNVRNPRSQINRHSLYEKTKLERGCTIGANATIVCGVKIGSYAFVGSGAVVTKDVPAYALVVGNPARQVGWMSRHGQRLESPDSNGTMKCSESGYRYHQVEPGVLRCIDLDENAPLPEHLMSKKYHRQMK